jgi:hypothetical protein
MSSINQFCHYSKPIEFLLYVNRDSGESYVHWNIHNDIHDILKEIKKKILLKMNDLDMESIIFEQLDVMCDTIDNDIHQYSQNGICDTYSIVDENLNIIDVIEEHYVDIEALEKYNIHFITAYDYTNARKLFLKDCM